MKQIIVILLTAALLPSCHKFVDIPLPDNSLSRDQVFTSDSKATFAVTSIYGSMINTQTFASNQTTICGALSSDELIPYNPNVLFDQINKNEIRPDNAQAATIWNTAYKYVYLSNAVIEGLLKSTGVSEQVKQSLIVECRFIRAFSYFYLINFYGNVPLLTETDYKENSLKPRTAVSQVYDFIISELSAVKSVLPATYNGTEKVRPNKWTAAALLARVYLYRERWADAERECSEIIESGLYTPLEVPSNTFLKNSKEAIWQLMPASGVLSEMQQLRPNGVIPQYSIQPSLLGAFEAGDLRKKAWIDSITYNSVKYYYTAKYRNTTSTPKEYYMVLRSPELFLIRAEAKVMQDKVAEAVSDINVIRQRAGLSLFDQSLSKQDAISAIEQERRVEFFCEWGHRWFDLNRRNRSDAVLSPLKPGWSATDKLYPILDVEIINNYMLIQNPGY